MIYRNNRNNKNANLDLDSDVESPRIKKATEEAGCLACTHERRGKGEGGEVEIPKKLPTVEIFRNTGCFLAYANYTEKNSLLFAWVGTKKT